MSFCKFALIKDNYDCPTTTVLSSLSFAVLSFPFLSFPFLSSSPLSGYLYQSNESCNSNLPSYNSNKTITMKLDMGEGTLQFQLNGSIVATVVV